MLIFGKNEALLLIALALGYIVLYLAKREEKGLQFLGYFLGTLVISVSALLIIRDLFIGGCVFDKAKMHDMMMKRQMMALSTQK